MKQDFHGYYKPSEAEFSKIWDEATIVVDANILLNLYTYSTATSDEVLKLLNEFDERLWIPHQVAHEYHENRCGIILKEVRRYSDIDKALDTIGAALRAKKQHPYISEELSEKFEDLKAEIKSELQKGKSAHQRLITDDEICEKISDCFNGKVGSPLGEKEILEIHKDGAIRYGKKIPPGYKDIKKPEPDRYGDLLIWHQMMKHSKTSKRSVIFVTDDLKEDWWAFAEDKRIGPRPELRHEFRLIAENDIYIYSSDAFIEIANKQGKKLSDVATEEIEKASEVRQIDAIEEREIDELLKTYDDPVNKLIKHQEALERLTRDPFEKFRKQQEAFERLTRDPFEKIRKQQELFERINRDPFEKFRKQMEALERFKQRVDVKPDDALPEED